MNFSAIIDALNHASAFELYRLRFAIDRKLDDPLWIEPIRWRLRKGQEIDYFSATDNALRRARILEFRRKQVEILDLGDGRRWLIEFHAINIDGLDVQVREQVNRGLGRNEVAIGQTLGFIDREGTERSGEVMRLNDKTVTLKVGHQQWRVTYQLLHHVIDAQAGAAVDLPGQATLLPVSPS